MHKITTLLLLCLTLSLHTFSQASYIRSQLTLNNMLNGKAPLNLRKAVYSVENAWYNGNLSKETFNRQIDLYTEFCRYIIQSGDIRYEG